MAQSSTAHECIVVGAGWTGLATAAALRSFSVKDFLLLEAGDAPGEFWRRSTYDRIKLHTAWHGLPCDGGAALFDYPMFKTGDEVVRYLTSYHDRHHLHAHSRFGHRVQRVQQVRQGLWRLYVETNDGVKLLECRHLALCVSKLRRPFEPHLAGRETFLGRCLHSSDFRCGSAFCGKRVVVAGSGNSACEIALDLASQGGAAQVTMLIAAPREFVPLCKFGELMRKAWHKGLAPCLEERVFADWSLRFGEAAFEAACAKRSALMASIAEDTSQLGISTPSVGFGEAQVQEGRISVFDHGALPLMRSGRIGVVRSRLQSLTVTGALLADGTHLEADAIVLATGFEPRYEELVDAESFLARGQPGKGVSPECLTPRTDGHDRSSVDASLFFVGADHAVNGGMAMGMQGWSCGFRIAQALGHLPNTAVFTLDALPERQCTVIATRRRRRMWHIVALAAVVAATAWLCGARGLPVSLLLPPS